MKTLLILLAFVSIGAAGKPKATYHLNFISDKNHTCGVAYDIIGAYMTRNLSDPAYGEIYKSKNCTYVTVIDFREDGYSGDGLTRGKCFFPTGTSCDVSFSVSAVHLSDESASRVSQQQPSGVPVVH